MQPLKLQIVPSSSSYKSLLVIDSWRMVALTRTNAGNARCSDLQLSGLDELFAVVVVYIYSVQKQQAPHGVAMCAKKKAAASPKEIASESLDPRRLVSSAIYLLQHCTSSSYSRRRREPTKALCDARSQPAS